MKSESSLDNTMVEVQESNNVSFSTAGCGQRSLQLGKEAWRHEWQSITDIEGRRLKGFLIDTLGIY
jgi:hypothetical protein